MPTVQKKPVTFLVVLRHDCILGTCSAEAIADCWVNLNTAPPTWCQEGVMKYFRTSARTLSRASARTCARIGILGGALLILLWIGISATLPGGGVTAAPELASARSPVQTPIPVAATAPMDSPARAAAPSDSAFED